MPDHHVADVSNGFWPTLKNSIAVTGGSVLLLMVKNAITGGGVKKHVDGSLEGLRLEIKDDINRLHDRMDKMDEKREDAKTDQEAKNEQVSAKLADLKDEQLAQGFILRHIAEKMQIDVQARQAGGQAV